MVSEYLKSNRHDKKCDLMKISLIPLQFCILFIFLFTLLLPVPGSKLDAFESAAKKYLLFFLSMRIIPQNQGCSFRLVSFEDYILCLD